MIDSPHDNLADLSTAKLLRHLADRYAAPLELYARQWCNSPEDAVQEAFIKLARESPRPDNIPAWLYRVTRNAAISAGRSAQRRRQHETDAATNRQTWFEPTDSTGFDSAEIQQALDELPDQSREIVVAHLWGGLSFEAIATWLGGSSSTVHRHYQSGLTALKERLATDA